IAFAFIVLGLFAQVERGITHYSIVQSIQALQAILKSTCSTPPAVSVGSPSPSPSPSSTSSSSNALKFHSASSTAFKFNNSSSSTNSSAVNITHFTTLQTCIVYNNSINSDVKSNYLTTRRLRPGTILEQCRPRSLLNNQNNINHTASRTNLSKSSSPSRHGTGSTLRTFISSIPQTINKHFTHRKDRYDYLEVKCQHSGELFLIRMDEIGAFVPVIAHINPPPLVSRRSSGANIFASLNKSTSSSNTHSLFTAEVLSKCSNQYPFITELITSRLLEDNDANNNSCYPFRRSTVHRCETKHARIIAFDMKHYTFIELDKQNHLDLYIIEQQDILQRYQAQIRWCNDNIQLFRSSIKSIIYTQNGGSPLFVQALPSASSDMSRRNSIMSSIMTSPSLTQTIWNSRPTPSSISKRATPIISRIGTPIKFSAFNTERNNNLKKPVMAKYLNGLSSAQTPKEPIHSRIDVRAYFNDPKVQERLSNKKKIDDDDMNSRLPPQYPPFKRTTFVLKKHDLRSNSAESDSENEEDDGEQNESYECTPL
ncbi:unnamed protein product, partial [Didymodactylos carnosus]